MRLKHLCPRLRWEGCITRHLMSRRHQWKANVFLYALDGGPFFNRRHLHLHTLEEGGHYTRPVISLWCGFALRVARTWNACVLAHLLTGTLPYAPPEVLLGALEDSDAAPRLLTELKDAYLPDYHDGVDLSCPRPIPPHPEVSAELLRHFQWA